MHKDIKKIYKELERQVKAFAVEKDGEIHYTEKDLKCLKDLAELVRFLMIDEFKMKELKMKEKEWDKTKEWDEAKYSKKAMKKMNPKMYDMDHMAKYEHEDAEAARRVGRPRRSRMDHEVLDARRNPDPMMHPDEPMVIEHESDKEESVRKKKMGF